MKLGQEEKSTSTPNTSPSVGSTSSGYTFTIGNELSPTKLDNSPSAPSNKRRSSTTLQANHSPKSNCIGTTNFTRYPVTRVLGITEGSCSVVQIKTTSRDPYKINYWQDPNKSDSNNTTTALVNALSSLSFSGTFFH